ncbi:zona pellucida sperm-binding protein 3-like isoform X2 [Micropterus salmoides]|uniref:zona pellucida sperm-binding protein 3-like isoform X2 n=1 Tax=Micropterus salmoides TaxID=27706 RepID=UPI0018EC7427|nr:zona pellucida sperm-binding protein 3-like isoform X2 [Micropterus salmoides]
MDRNLQVTSFWQIVVLISVSKLTESRLVSSRGSSEGRTHGDVPPQPVAVNCHPDSLEIVLQADMFDMGIQLDGRHLRLGSDSVSDGSACGVVPSGEAEFTIWAHHMDCGTKLSSTKGKIIYSNVLVYSPEPSSDGLLRLNGATIPVECHYDKRYAVDGISLHPTWVPFVKTASAEDQLVFNLRTMTEVSAIIGNHMPLRVYVDHCVATATPDAEATLRYDFIKHHGCLFDGYLTNSSSHFLPRVEEHKLRFQVDAFRFYQGPSNQVYIACYVKAVPVVLTVSSQNRACSVIENRWRSADGNDQACRSCDISHRVEESLPTEPPKTTISNKSWPSMTPQETLVQNRAKQPPASYFRFRPGMHQKHNHPPQSSARLKRGAKCSAQPNYPAGTHYFPAIQQN